MASLRKRADAAATDADAPEIAISVEADTTPKASADVTEALARQIGALRESEAAQQQAQAMQAANERRQAWLAQTPGAKDDVDALGHFHHAALDAGLVDTSPEYFSFLESQLAALKHPTTAATHIAEEMQQRTAQAPEPAPIKPRSIVSAPVSRNIPNSNGRRSSNGRITLSPAEQEAARNSGISIEEYAKQKLRLSAMKASGEYGEQQR